MAAKIRATKGLVALWDFKEAAGQSRKAQGKGSFPLQEQGGALPRVADGPLSGYSTIFSGDSTGKPTSPFPYSIDYSASPQTVPPNTWVCVAFTYNGSNIKSFLNGEFKARVSELIDHTKGFTGYPDGLTQSKNPYEFTEGLGDNGSDFTVGAVLLKAGMGNFFKGQIGGLAVFNRALSEAEIAALSAI